MTGRQITISSSIVLFAIALSLFLEDPISDSLSGNVPRNDPDLYMLNAQIKRYANNGFLAYQLSADRFTHFPLTNLTTLVTPNLMLLSKESTPWEINAEQGRLMPKSPFREEIVELWSNVSAHKEETNGHFIKIKTDSLTVFPDKNYAETNEKIYITENNTVTTAAGLRANFEASTFVLLSSKLQRVKTSYTSSSHR